MLNGIQALRAFAALLVVLLHVAVTEDKYGNPVGHIFDGFLLGHAGVDIFFVISGFVMVLTASHRSGSSVEARWFLIKRVVRIYPVYWAYCLLVLGAWMVVPQWINSSSAGDTNLVASFLLFPSEGIPLLMVAWTLEFEIFFYALFAGAMILPRRTMMPILLTGLGLLSLVGIIANPELDFLKVVISPMLIEFAFGCILAWLYLRRSWRGGMISTLVGLVLLIASSAGVNWTVVAGIAETNLARPLTYGLAGALLVHGVVSLEKQGRLKYPEFVLKLGDASYTLYLSHLLVLSAVGRLWQGLGADQLPNILFIPILIIAATAWALIGYRYIEQPLIEHGRRMLDTWKTKQRAVPIS